MSRATSIAVVALLVSSCLPANGAPPRDYGYDPRPDFIAFNPHYRELKQTYQQELDALQKEMIRQQRAGRKTPCTRQVFLEAKWRLYNTADFTTTARRMDDLRKMLAAPKDPHDGGQVPEDGSFGCCSEVWFHKLDATTDKLIAMGQRWREPEHPVKLLERINTPEKLTAYLDSVLIADVRKTGLDTRYELNSASSALTRYILWEGTLKEIPTKFPLHPGLKKALIDYEDDKWQDPDTGFWGTWYRTADGSVIKTADLSHTFHLVHFRDGRVKRWPQIVATTLAMRDREYPYGWLEDGQMTNHHNYDAALLLHRGWPHATDAQKEQIRAAMRETLDWCLTKSLQPDGSFDVQEDTLGASFYFGVAFLNEVGFFSKANRFWTDEEFPQTEEVRGRILKRIRELKLDDPESQWAAMILQFSR